MIFWYISDKNGSEFYNMFTSKAEAEEECRRRGGGYVGQLYRVNFEIDDVLGFAEGIIYHLYEKLYECVSSQANDWCVTEEEKEEYFNAVFSDFEEMKNKNSQWAYCCFACVYCDGVCAVCPIMRQNGNCLRGEYGDYIAAKGISDNESINHDAKVISSLLWRDEQ